MSVPHSRRRNHRPTPAPARRPPPWAVSPAHYPQSQTRAPLALQHAQISTLHFSFARTRTCEEVVALERLLCGRVSGAQGREVEREGGHAPNRATPSAALSPGSAQCRWYTPVSTSRTRRISRAWIAMSLAWPDAPPEGSARRPRQQKGGAGGARGGRTVDHDARVRERVALAARAGREEQRAHRARLADAVRVDRRGHVLRCVSRARAEAGGVRTCIWACVNAGARRGAAGRGVLCRRSPCPR